MKVAILGGSFNPPHLCHIFIAHYVLATAEVDQLWLLPCYKHAFGKILAPFHHRLAMCALAITSFQQDLVKVLPLEQERQGTSWTIDTVRYVKQKYPNIDFSWIIGSDVLDELDQWKEFGQLQHLISFLVVPRADYRRETIAQQDRVSHSWEESPGLQRLQEQCEALEHQGIRFPNISSSLVRERVKRHHSIHHLVSQRVEEYIYAHDLYK
jgi:nicotinate-nucleotide adenylyltransferase